MCVCVCIALFNARRLHVGLSGAFVRTVGIRTGAKPIYPVPVDRRFKNKKFKNFIFFARFFTNFTKT